MSDFVLDASLALQWFLEDETDRQYSLQVLNSIAESRAFVPQLWFYEIGNGLLMAYRRKRITMDQMDAFLARLKALPVESALDATTELFDLPVLAQTHGLTNYDAAYLAAAIHMNLPLATADKRLRNAAVSAGVKIFNVQE